MAVGRPTDYNSEMANKILQKLAEGQSVSDICLADDMPNRSTVFLWSATHKEFSDRYLLALKAVGQIEVDSINDIEKLLLAGEIDAPTANVIMTSRRWKAGKFYPKMYGDKQIVESKNENHNYNTDVPLSEDDLAILRRAGFKDV